jgi:methionyl-tRNA synthetase
MSRKIIVTSALPYANGPIHIGHLVEYVQTDIWVRFQKMQGNECLYFCADDTHGTPVMISSKRQGVTPEQLIEKVHKEHLRDFNGFEIEFDNYYTTHSQENRQLSEEIFKRISKAGSVQKKTIEQAYCGNCKMFLPDRFIKGTCPRCKAEEQYGDSCDKCGGTHHPTELVDAVCATCGTPPVRKESEHYFFKLADYKNELKELINSGYAQKSTINKLDEWFDTGLKDWDISRDGPYFGFKIPGEENKYFYVWLDAPVGYMASVKNYCAQKDLDFEDVWNSGDYEIYHFIGKDIMYFHALFWPAMLMGADFRVADKLFVHGFLTVDGKKMSKSKGTFIKADTYLEHLDPQLLRYYYAGKLTNEVNDIDLNFGDFINKTNSDLVGKFANLASRSVPMLVKKLDSQLGEIDQDGRDLVNELLSGKDEIISNYESLNYASAVRKINVLADKANQYIEKQQPWVTIKDDKETARKTLTAAVNAVKIITTYLKPILPDFAGRIEKILNTESLMFDNIDNLLENCKVNKFQRLIERIDEEKVNAMVEESKESQCTQKEDVNKKEIEPLAEECTIDDFAKIDMRVAKVIKAEAVEGADKLLKLQLDIGVGEKTVFAGVAQAYEPDQLDGKMVICLANLKPRKMRFGTSEGMILAAGEGGKDISVLTIDDGAKPGERVS